MAAVRERSGIVGDVKGLATTGLRAIRTRFELLSIEIKEEKAWAVRFLVIAVAALYLLSFGLLLAIFALVVWAAEADRPAILAGFTGSSSRRAPRAWSTSCTRPNRARRSSRTPSRS